MTDQELELAILQRYVEHLDAIGMKAPKCARELDMKEVISTAIGEPAAEVVVQRWHSCLAPPSPPYPPGVLRPCSDSTVNKGPHRFHARAYFETGKKPTWDRIAELRSQLPQESIPQKEKEQKFRILNSLRQATPDFALYCSGLNADVTIGVLFIDIDNFKSLNTRFTESTVDEQILIPFQQLLYGACLYRGDAYRHGGEEFLVLLPNHTVGEVTQFAERLRGKIEAEQFFVSDISVRITASIGIALWPQHGGTLDDLIAKANRAEHEAKENGRNRIEFYEETT